MAYSRVFVLGMLLFGSLAANVPASSKDEPASQRSDAAESGESVSPVRSTHTKLNRLGVTILSTDPRAFPVNHLPPLTYSSKKYTVYTTAVTFFQAWQMCISNGQRLATIESYADNKAMREAIFEYADFEHVFWIAATNLGAKRSEHKKFFWITNDRPVGYLNGFENWLLGAPPTGPNQCVAIYLRSALWIYGSCDAIAYYVCEESQDV